MLRYPPIRINSKNEFLKHVLRSKVKSDKTIKNAYEKCGGNKDLFWDDHPEKSDFESGKIIRRAFGPLSKILRIVDSVLLKPYDDFLPPYIHGGLSKKSNVKAALDVLKGENRTVLTLDLKRFYEQIEPKMVSVFLFHCGCKGSSFRNFISHICCVPKGRKGHVGGQFKLARGFAPSGRIASWISYPFVVAVKNLVDKRLKGHCPRIAVYFDDIGISAESIDIVQVEKLKEEIFNLATSYRMRMNIDKIKTYQPNQMQEFLGVAKYGEHFFPGEKVRKNRKEAIGSLLTAKTSSEKKKAHGYLKGCSAYKRSIKKYAKLNKR